MSNSNELSRFRHTTTSNHHLPAGVDPSLNKSFYLDNKANIEMWSHYLPHWQQDGKIQFITFRLADSLPQSKLQELKRDKQLFFLQNPEPVDKKKLHQFLKSMNRKIEYWLSQGYGECVLKNEEVRQILMDSIDYVNGERALIFSYVIMPNHVHLLLVELLGNDVHKVIGSIRQYSATRINRKLGRSGSLWQTEPFDVAIRSEDHFRYCIDYIRRNPNGLPLGDYHLFFDWPLIDWVLKGG